MLVFQRWPLSSFLIASAACVIVLLLVIRACSNKPEQTVPHQREPLRVTLYAPKTETQAPEGADTARIHRLLYERDSLARELRALRVQQVRWYDTTISRTNGRYDRIRIGCDDINQRAHLDIMYAPEDIKVPTTMQAAALFVDAGVSWDGTFIPEAALGGRLMLNDALQAYLGVKVRLLDQVIKPALCAGIRAEF